METKKGEIVEVKPPSQLIQLAIDKGNVDLDKLEKLLMLQERFEKNEALKAYNRAMSEFKANPPKIDKDKTVKFGTTKFNHASLFNVTDKITASLSKHGLSASWRTKQNGKIVVACRITHVMGHYEEVELAADADTSGSKNSIQALGSTISYLERYTLLAATGLAAEDMDDDGQSAVVEYIDDKQRNELTDLAIDCGADMPKFMAYLKVEDLAKLPKADFNKAKLALIAKKGKKVAK